MAYCLAPTFHSADSAIDYPGLVQVPAPIATFPERHSPPAHIYTHTHTRQSLIQIVSLACGIVWTFTLEFRFVLLALYCYFIVAHS